MPNKNTYESIDVVNTYISSNHLQKPEETILNKIKTEYKNELKNMNMLDIGVGGGRTTLHFAKLVNKYVAIDYSEEMIKSCKKRFNNQENLSFKVADARELKEFADNSFELVLFSFNGLDYVNHNDRNKALKEIKRVLKKGGMFIFSTHNLNSLDKIYTVKISKSPKKLAWRIFKIGVLFLLNGPIKRFIKKKWVIINDGAQKFRLKTYYVNPEYMIQQLNELNFNETQLYSLDNGQQIPTDNLRKIDDPWIYYVCKK